MMRGNRILRILWLLVGISVAILSCQSRTDVQFRQYYAQGEVLYKTHCSNCHQKNGKGLGLIYPPLDESDFMDNNFDEVICIMKVGKSGVLVVNGNTYHQPMPGISTLTNLEITEIATFIYNSWGNKKGQVELSEVSGILKACEAGAQID